MTHAAQKTNCRPTTSFIEPEFSVVAMLEVERARRQGIDPASVPVRELEAEALAIIEAAGGFDGLLGSEP